MFKQLTTASRFDGFSKSRKTAKIILHKINKKTFANFATLICVSLSVILDTISYAKLTVSIIYWHFFKTLCSKSANEISRARAMEIVEMVAEDPVIASMDAPTVVTDGCAD